MTEKSNQKDILMYLSKAEMKFAWAYYDLEGCGPEELNAQKDKSFYVSPELKNIIENSRIQRKDYYSKIILPDDQIDAAVDYFMKNYNMHHVVEKNPVIKDWNVKWNSYFVSTINVNPNQLRKAFKMADDDFKGKKELWYSISELNINDSDELEIRHAKNYRISYSISDFYIPNISNLQTLTKETPLRKGWIISEDKFNEFVELDKKYEELEMDYKKREENFPNLKYNPDETGIVYLNMKNEPILRLMLEQIRKCIDPNY